MTPLSRILGGVQQAPDGHQAVDVVGIAYVGPLQARGRVKFDLVREPHNEHDRNAIGVHLRGKRVGYLPRRLAALYAIDMDHSGQRSWSAPGAVSDEYTASVWLPAPVNRWPIVPPIPPRQHQSWGNPTVKVEIDDENEFGEAIRELVTRSGGAPAEIEWQDEPVVIVDDRPLPVVYLRGLPVGRLPLDTARQYGGSLQQLGRHGVGLAASARLWARVLNYDTYARVTLQLPLSDEVFVPAGLPKAAHVVLPAGKKIQVTGEEQHLAEIAGLLQGAGSRPVVATLHELVRERGKPVVEVRCMGQRVGQLTPVMSDHLLPVIQAATRKNLVAACRARVEGNALKADVVLEVARAGDLPQAWINQHLGSV